MFIAAHAIGQGAVIWVFISEIFPNKIRAMGQSFGASVHWIFAAVITLVTPIFLDEKEGLFKNPWPIFVFFAVYDGPSIDLGFGKSSRNKKYFIGRP